jgi:hypothetical protein
MCDWLPVCDKNELRSSTPNADFNTASARSSGAICNIAMAFANGQPAAVTHVRAADGSYDAYGI